jgi:VanZ family protein
VHFCAKSAANWQLQSRKFCCGERQIRLSSGVPKRQKFLFYWLPLLLWMAMIFTASSDADSARHSSTLFEPLLRWLFPHLSQPRVEQIHYAFRKSCHLAEFAVLAVLAWRAVRQPQKNDARPWRWDEAGLALAIVLLYAASDELHQVFIPSRTGQASDVIVDVCGGTIGLALRWLGGKIFRHC